MYAGYTSEEMKNRLFLWTGLFTFFLLATIGLLIVLSRVGGNYHAA
nr:hypothetical protein [Klebsiella pneumoniae subsp. pneumoniae]